MHCGFGGEWLVNGYLVPVSVHVLLVVFQTAPDIDVNVNETYQAQNFVYNNNIVCILVFVPFGRWC